MTQSVTLAVSCHTFNISLPGWGHVVLRHQFAASVLAARYLPMWKMPHPQSCLPFSLSFGSGAAVLTVKGSPNPVPNPPCVHRFVDRDELLSGTCTSEAMESEERSDDSRKDP